MKKNILLIIIFLSQGIMSWGQSDTLSYESILSYYESKTKEIESYQSSGNTDKASKLEKERDEYIDALGDNYGKALFYSVLSDAYHHFGDYQSAIITCSKAVDIFKNHLGMEHPGYATSLDNLASYYFSLDNYSEAIRLGTEAMEIRKKILGVEHRDYAVSLSNLASYYSSVGNYSEAIRLGSEALGIYKNVLGIEHPDYAMSLDHLAGYYSALGNYTEAIRLETDAKDLFKGLLGRNHPQYALALEYLCYKSTLQIATQDSVMNELPCLLSVLFVTVQILF